MNVALDRWVRIVAILALAALTVVACEQKAEESGSESEAAESAEGAEPEGEPAEGTEAAGANAEGMDHAGMDHEASGDDAAPVGELVAQPGAEIGDRTVCPIMDGEFEVTADSPSVEHDGKKVFFCCAGCDTKFEEDPEGHLAKHAETIAAKQAGE